MNMRVKAILMRKNQKFPIFEKCFQTLFKVLFLRVFPQKGREVDHQIEFEPNTKAPYRPLFQLSQEELAGTKQYIVEILESGKSRPSKSPYGAPLFFVKEKDNKLHAVFDYRGLNRITMKNRTPLLRTDEMFDHLGGAKYFTKLDLKTGFNQIRLSPDDIEKTAFYTKYGQYEYLVMPMGF